MFNPLISFRICVSTATLLAAVSLARAGESVPALDSAAMQPDNRYGLFNSLDRRSSYGQGAYPEPFLVDDSDLEVNEARLDWLHTKTNQMHSDLVTAELEKGFGQLTLELEVPYERDAAPGQTTQGFDNVNLGARYPLYQYVSNGGFIDTTFGTAIEAGIPTNSPLSKNAEIVPKVFNDLKLGRHFTVQTVLGYSMLYGGGDAGGLQTFEYGFVFGYTIPRKELKLPGVMQLIPVFELQGNTQANKDNPGHNSLTGGIGLRCNLQSIGPIQPKPGIEFVFPIDKGAREETHWGIYTSLVFEY
jgi:hypothetical protein